MKRFERIIILVFDSMGIGSAPDAERFGDAGANTVGHIVRECGPLRIPNLFRMGFSKIADVGAYDGEVCGVFGRMRERSAGKDTTSGHWEMLGAPVETPFPVFPDGFPKDMLDTFTEATGYGYLGNEAASGTEIIDCLGAEHMRTGKPIVYTSADSVLQIAAHESVIPIEELYRICRVARESVCTGAYDVGRVIARPFVGEQGHFMRTAHRHDFSRLPDKTLYSEMLQAAGIPVIGIGKIGDIYAHKGLDASYPTVSDAHGMAMTAKVLGDASFATGLLLVNLVEFDSLYGHRRDVAGYGRHIEDADVQLGGLLEILEEGDLLVVTADHGNDPTWRGSDHTRELVPVLAYCKGIDTAIDIGLRETFADLGQTVLDNFGLRGTYGESFLSSFASIR